MDTPKNFYFHGTKSGLHHPVLGTSTQSVLGEFELLEVLRWEPHGKHYKILITFI